MASRVHLSKDGNMIARLLAIRFFNDGDRDVESVSVFFQQHWDTIFLSEAGLLVWFIFIYSAIHYFRIFRRPFNEVQWKYVDYLWLAFAAIGVVTAINTVKMQRYQEDYQLARFIENRGASEMATLLRELARSSTCLAKDPLAVPDPALVRICQYYDERLEPDWENRPTFPSAQRLNLDLAELGAVNNPGFVAMLGATVRAAERFKGMTNDTDAAKAKLSPTITYLVMQAMTPLMLIIALALRTAKVTGEILLKDKEAFNYLRKYRRKKTKDVTPSLEPEPETLQVGPVPQVKDDVR